MIVISLIQKKAKKLLKDILLVPKEVDIIELRLDGFQEIPFQELVDLKKSCNKPLLFTLRQKKGRKEKNRLLLIEKLLHIEPEFFDIESFVDFALVEEWQKKFPKTKFILSYHNEKETPKDLEALLHSLKRPLISLYKIATTAKEPLDNLRMALFAKNHPEIIAFCMGEMSTPSRLLSSWVYCYLKTKTAKGQLLYSDALYVYRAREIHNHTLYSLLGSSIEKSPSHISHNRVFIEQNLSATYIKIPINQNSLKEALFYLQKLNFRGLSITSPLKESIIPYVDEISNEAKTSDSINTLLLEHGKRIGYSTDGKGALFAIEEKFVLSNKRVAILGGGGAAKAIALALREKTPYISLYTRSKQKLENFASKNNFSLFSLPTKEKITADLIIQATSAKKKLLKAKAYPPYVALLDINYSPKYTPFLLAGQKKHSTLIFGYKMFVFQALEQMAIWFPNFSRTSALKILEKSCKRFLR